MFRCESSSKSKGQSLVELALIMPFAILLLALSADFGRALTAYIQVGSAAREGAAYGMQSISAAEDSVEIGNAARASLSSSPNIWGNPINVVSNVQTDGSLDASGNQYQKVVVTVEHQFQPFITVGPIPNSIPMERTVEMRVVN
jgi:hypothetical protein